MTAGEEQVTAKSKTLSSMPLQAKEWEEIRPGTFERIMTAIEKEETHRRRMEWAELGLRIFGQVCAIATVVVLAFLARHFADLGAAREGALIIIGGALGIVGIFITNRLRGRGQR